MTCSKRVALNVFIASSLYGPAAASQQAVAHSLELRSASFAGDTITRMCTCDGQDRSPELSWTSPPDRTQSLVLIVNDKDTLFSFIFGYFVHWMLYDLPADTRELPEGVEKLGQLPVGSHQGQNDFDRISYGGPCPHGTASHRYVFALYALDTKLHLPSGASEKQVLKAMNGHVLGKGELTGLYHR